MRPFRLAALLLLAAPALAQAPGPAPGVAPPPPPPQPTGSTDLFGTSCGDFLAMLANSAPPPNATSDETQSAQRSQADVYMVMAWVAGYQTFKRGVPLTKAKVDRDWLVKNTQAMAKTCKANPAQTIYQAGAALP